VRVGERSLHAFDEQLVLARDDRACLRAPSLGDRNLALESWRRDLPKWNRHCRGRSLSRNVDAMRFLRVLSLSALISISLVSGAPAQDAGTAGGPSAIGITNAVQAFVRDRDLGAGAVSVHVIDVASGAVLASYEPKKPLNPASTMKIYTAVVALSTLHADHKYVTTISGRLAGTSVKGPLVLRGTGDPTFATRDIYGMVHELKAHGVKRIDGDILVDSRAFDDQYTPPGFEQQPNEWAYFRAPVSAVPLERNVIKMSARAQESGSAVVTFDPPGFVDVEGEVSSAGSGSGATLELSPVGNRLRAKVGGSVTGLVRYARRVEDPSLLAGFALRAALVEMGVNVTGEVKVGGQAGLPTLALHESPPLSAILHALGKQSDNFTAETVFKSLAGEKNRPARFADASQVLTDFVRDHGFLDDGMVFRNGSGLFDSNRVTTRSMAELLRYAYREPSIASEFVAQLSIGGVDGTLGAKSHRFRDYRRVRAIRAKTGTLERVAALAGYVLGPEGRAPIAFAVIGNGVAPATVRQHADAIAAASFEYLWGRKAPAAEKTPAADKTRAAEKTP